jgi:uncharacterized protein YrrD
MMYRASEVLGLKVEATDGRIGKVDDIFFDEAVWKVRHFVVDAGGWIQEREVLIAPQAMTGISITESSIHTELSREKVENSPPLQTDLPVSRQYERFLYEYYGWRPYWVYPDGFSLAEVYPPDTGEEKPEGRTREQGAGLEGADVVPMRSWRDVSGHRVHAADGFFGHVDDLLLSPTDWSVVGVVVNTAHWWQHHDIVIDVSKVKDVSWENECFEVAMTSQELRDATPFKDEMLWEGGPEGTPRPWQTVAGRPQGDERRTH